MSKIQELEDELRRLKMEEHQRKYQASLKKEDEFRKEKGLDVYTSDDYCGMSSGRYSFYYGYEITKNGQWCFTADVDGKEVMRLKRSELWPEDGEEPFWYLLAGIAQFLKQIEAHPTTNNGREEAHGDL